MREVHPLGLVPYSIIMNALAYQVQYRSPMRISLRLNGDQATRVAGRPGKCRSRKAIAKQSKEAGAGQIDVGAELPGSLRFEHDPQQQRLQRAGFFGREALLQLTDGHCCAAATATTTPHTAPTRNHGVLVVLTATHNPPLPRSHVHFHHRAQEGDPRVTVAFQQVIF